MGANGESQGSERSPSDHPEMVGARQVDHQEESEKRGVVRVADAIVHPGTCKPCSAESQLSAKTARERDEQWWSILSTQVRHWRQ